MALLRDEILALRHNRQSLLSHLAGSVQAIRTHVAGLRLAVASDLAGARRAWRGPDRAGRAPKKI